MDNIASLVCHQHMPSKVVREIVVSGARGEGGLITLRYTVIGDIGGIHIPEPTEPERRNGLWKTTCFELFTQDVGQQAYREYNFSPSGAWAAYSFSAYRQGMSDVDIWAPRIAITADEESLVVDVTFVSPRLAPQHVGAYAIIEEEGGAQSFWALRHPPGKPDFHNEFGFSYLIPATESE